MRIKFHRSQHRYCMACGRCRALMISYRHVRTDRTRVSCWRPSCRRLVTATGT